MRVVILGAGGHGQVVADILIQAYKFSKEHVPIAFLDDDPALIGKNIMGLPVRGSTDQIHPSEHEALVVAIGDNAARKRIFDAVQTLGNQIANAIHPTAVIADDVSLGIGVTICAGVVVNTGTIIGDNVILNTGCTVDHHSLIESHVHVAPGVNLGGGIRINEGALVGIGAAVIPGRTVGDWAVLGAGSVATKDVPPHSVAVGVPARVIKGTYLDVS